MHEAYSLAYWAKEPGVLRLFDGVPELVWALREASVPVDQREMGKATRDVVAEHPAALGVLPG